MGGIMDTLDGSCGLTFTYLPIVYQDNSQITSSRSEFFKAEQERYRLAVNFLTYDDFIPKKDELPEALPWLQKSSL
jgi:hypothetical protein